MKNPEEAIERVLTGLRDAEVPAGMEARILRAMESRTVANASRGWWREWMAGGMTARGEGWRLAGGAVVAVICSLAVLVVSMHRASQIEPDERRVQATTASRGFGGTKEVVSQRLKAQYSGRYGTAEAVPLSKTVDRATGQAASGTSHLSSEVEGHVDYESVAVSEMIAPSKPAPPLPLTHQEKLLAQVVHKGDPEQIADLKPQVRAKQMEVSKAEFQDFFEPQPPVKESE